MASLFRKAVDGMEGYTPGEQPSRPGGWIKLNTNENPYPPCPGASEVLRDADISSLRLYPDPLCGELRKTIASLHGLSEENVIVGNGSDDILTIVTRCFAGENDLVCTPEPSYSLYPVLAEIQGATCRKIPLEGDFSLPANFAESAEGAKIIFLARPNAPTGNACCRSTVEKLCADFDGIVLVDEAYAEFADDNCVDLAVRYPNVIVCRTLSKSYSLAGIRLGYAIASPTTISGMMKVKDSYNVNRLTQLLAIAAISDQQYLRGNIAKIRNTRSTLSSGLTKLGYSVVPSQANFVFASPPDGDAEKIYLSLKAAGILVRYFPGPVTGRYIRITVGTDEQTSRLLVNL